MGCFFSLSPFVAYIIKESDTPYEFLPLYQTKGGGNNQKSNVFGHYYNGIGWDYGLLCASNNQGIS